MTTKHSKNPNCSVLKMKKHSSSLKDKSLCFPCVSQSIYSIWMWIDLQVVTLLFITHFPGMNMDIVVRSSVKNEKTILIIVLFWNLKNYSGHIIFQWYIYKQMKHFFFVNCNPQICLYTNKHTQMHTQAFVFLKRRGMDFILDPEIEEILFCCFLWRGSGISPSLSLSKIWSSVRAHLIKILGEW